MTLLKRWILLLVISVTLTGLTFAAPVIQEQEPNDTPAQANSLRSPGTVVGDINPAGDVDYFAIPGMGTGWGTIALLDVTASQHSWDGALTVLAPDGNTVLGENDGAWHKGIFVAWHRYQGRSEHYIRVSEQGHNDIIDGYMLHVFSLPMVDRSEQEPNNTLATANTSSISHLGRVDAETDRDCFALYGDKDATLLLALNGDPLKHHNTTDFALRLYGPDGTLIDESDGNPAGRGEIIDEHTLNVSGVYTYCVEAHAGTVGEMYRVGPIYREKHYSPPFQMDAQLAPPEEGKAFHTGEIMRFHLSFTSTSPLPIPDLVRIGMRYEPQCQQVLDSGGATITTDRYLYWSYPQGIGGYEVISKTVTLRATRPCQATMRTSLEMKYYKTGWGGHNIPFRINYLYYLPALY